MHLFPDDAEYCSLIFCIPSLTALSITSNCIFRIECVEVESNLFPWRNKLINTITITTKVITITRPEKLKLKNTIWITH